jgi:hypothetical protein
VHANPMMFHALTKTHHSLMLEKMKEGILCDAKRKIMQLPPFIIILVNGKFMINQ